jgi:hypothetical protein
MTILGFTHTQASLPPPTDPFKPNNNVVLSPFSAFWGGAITNNIGAFAQVTYNAPPPGGFPDPFGHTWTWDNTDIRFAKSTSIGAFDVIYGVTANNNPTVQDIWNTTPAWSFPYAVSTIAPTPATHTLIEGAFAAHVGSVGAYTFINDKLYLEASAYRTFDFRSQNAVGVDPFSAPGLFDGAAPYWRVAFEPQWGAHSLMVGTFGMLANVNPWIDPTFALGTTGTFPQSDKYTDTGFDSQYQYQGTNYWLTLRGSYIREFQKLDATFANGGSANPADLLNSLHLQASLAYGGDNRFVFTDVINLRGLIIEGAGVGTNGIVFNTGQALTIENCVVRNLIGYGIVFEPTASSTLAVSNTLAANTANAGFAAYNSGSGAVTATFNRAEAYNNSVGIDVESLSTGTTAATVTDSVVGNNANDGFFALNANLMLFRSMTANNGIGVNASSSATIWIGQSTVTGNANGWVTTGSPSGTVMSYATNQTAPPSTPTK